VSVANAVKAGATRIELCANLTGGGTTPSIGAIKFALSFPNLQVFVLIRPRCGNFVYSEAEQWEMLADVEACRELGCHGVVVGGLRPDNTIDLQFLQAVMSRKGHMQVTFHRAFDFTPDPFLALDALVEAGVCRVLTTGGAANAMDGIHELQILLERAGKKIIILPGGGITVGNLRFLAESLPASEFHGSFKEKVSEFGGFGTVEASAEGGVREAIAILRQVRRLSDP